MAKRRKRKATPSRPKMPTGAMPKRTRIRPVDHAGLPLTPEAEAAYWLMNDPSADFYDRMEAALLLAPIMHKPMPPRYLTPEEQAENDRYLRSLGIRR